MRDVYWTHLFVKWDITNGAMMVKSSKLPMRLVIVEFAVDVEWYAVAVVAVDDDGVDELDAMLNEEVMKKWIPMMILGLKQTSKMRATTKTDGSWHVVSLDDDDGVAVDCCSPIPTGSTWILLMKMNIVAVACPRTISIVDYWPALSMIVKQSK